MGSEWACWRIYRAGPHNLFDVSPLASPIAGWAACGGRGSRAMSPCSLCARKRSAIPRTPSRRKKFSASQNWSVRAGREQQKPWFSRDAQARHPSAGQSQVPKQSIRHRCPACCGLRPTASNLMERTPPTAGREGALLLADGRCIFSRLAFRPKHRCRGRLHSSQQAERTVLLCRSYQHLALLPSPIISAALPPVAGKMGPRQPHAPSALMLLRSIWPCSARVP